MKFLNLSKKLIILKFRYFIPNNLLLIYSIQFNKKFLATFSWLLLTHVGRKGLKPEDWGGERVVFRIVFTRDDLAAGRLIRIFSLEKFTVSVYLEKSRNRTL